MLLSSLLPIHRSNISRLGSMWDSQNKINEEHEKVEERQEGHLTGSALFVDITLIMHNTRWSNLERFAATLCAAVSSLASIARVGTQGTGTCTCKQERQSKTHQTLKPMTQRMESGRTFMSRAENQWNNTNTLQNMHSSGNGFKAI